MMGLSAFLWGDNLLVVLAYIIFSAGLVLLIYRKEKKSIKIEVDEKFK